MNTVQTYTGQRKPYSMRGYEITKEALEEKVEILIDVVQSLIEHIAEKEQVQCGVLAEASTVGTRYRLYMQPLWECAACHSKLPMLKEGQESYPAGPNVFMVCWDCHYKSKNP